MLAAFALGAEGVQCGTRFLTVEECGVHEAWKEKVLKAKDSDTIVTGRGTGHPVRGLKNKFARECRKIEMAATSGEELEGMYAGSLARAVAGDVENGSVMAGQVAALVTERGTAAEVIANMVREAEALAGRSFGELAELNSRRARGVRRPPCLMRPPWRLWARLAWCSWPRARAPRSPAWAPICWTSPRWRTCSLAPRTCSAATWPRWCATRRPDERHAQRPDRHRGAVGRHGAVA